MYTGTETNEWKIALIEELVVIGIYNDSHDNNPKKALHDIICWNVDVALDPNVSSDAEKLVQQGRDEVYNIICA